MSDKGQRKAVQIVGIIISVSPSLYWTARNTSSMESLERKLQRTCLLVSWENAFCEKLLLEKHLDFLTI